MIRKKSNLLPPTQSKEKIKSSAMTTFYPSQPTPQFLKKYTRNVYNRVQNTAHFENGQQTNDDAALSLQVRPKKISLVIQSVYS